MNHTQKNPFPYEFGGRKAIDEMCTCNHRRSEHHDRFAYGHGPCGETHCSCTQYTWKGFVYGDTQKGMIP